MEQADRDTIQRNIVMLSSLVDLEALYRELIHQGIIDHAFVDRIKGKYKVKQEQAQEFFLSYTKRGPTAFSILVESLERSGHISEARALGSRNVGSNGHPEVSSTTGDVPGNNVPRHENVANGYFAPSPTSSNSPTSSASVPSSPLMRHHISRVEPLSGSNSPTSSSSSISNTDQLRASLATCTMADQPPLVIRVKLAEQYNMGLHHAYTMMSQPRGYALIINNLDFMGDLSAKRDGAEKDTVHLQDLLAQFGFHVMVRHNVTKMDLIHPENGIIRKFTDQFKTRNVDACVVAIMSHGKEWNIRSSDAENSRNPEQNYWNFYDEILKKFNNRFCPVLKGKPKMFIVQACQGERRDRGVRRTQVDGRDLTAESDVSSSFGEWIPPQPPDNIPETEDMIVCYSTVPGFVSNRDTEHGTWYIRSLCKVFMEFAWNTEIIKLLQRVGWEMRGIRSEFGAKQMSSFHVLGLHFDLYFNPGLYEDNVQVREQSNNGQDVTSSNAMIP